MRKTGCTYPPVLSAKEREREKERNTADEGAAPLRYLVVVSYHRIERMKKNVFFFCCYYCVLSTADNAFFFLIIIISQINIAQIGLGLRDLFEE